MSEITTVGPDLAKRVVSLCGEDALGRVVMQRTLRRGAPAASALRDSEERRAAGTAGRASAPPRLTGRAHRRLEPAARVAGEFGRVYANSAAAILGGARAALPDETLPAALGRGVARQLEHLRELDAHLAECDHEIAQQGHDDPRAQRLVRLSGVGVLTASAVAAAVVDPQQLRCGRQFAAWIGITPRQYSTGGKPRLGRIIRRGDTYRRGLLVQEARSALQAALRVHPTRRTRIAA